MNKYNIVVSRLIFNQIESGNKPELVVIFGAGQNGLWLHNYLEKINVVVDYFCDNSTSKQGSLINGVRCISLNELCKYKNDVVVLVSPLKSDDTIAELKNLDFPYIVSPDILNIFRFIPVFKSKDVFTKFPYIGHFYSLYPDIDEIVNKGEEIFDDQKELFDIDLNEKEQLLYLNKMIKLHSS